MASRSHEKRSFAADYVGNAELILTVTGDDGFVLNGHSSMSQISRDLEDLVRHTIVRHHQCPHGFMLFLGTLFTPTQDRDTPCGGFTHERGNVGDHRQ